MPVDFEERVLKHIDRHYESLGDHCRRITTLEQDHKNRDKEDVKKDKNRSNKIVYLLAGIVIIEFLFLAYDKVIIP